MADVNARGRGAQTVVDGIAHAKELDGVADAVSAAVERVTAPQLVQNALAGTWLGHALHPALTHVPIGAWLAASYLDVVHGERSRLAARSLVGLGVAAAVPTAATGSNDWATTVGGARRIGLVHGVANAAATALQLASWFARGRGARATGVALSVVAVTLAGASAYLGGDLSFRRGIGVNHTAFERRSTRWIDVAAESELVDGALLRVDAGGVPVVLVRHAGSISAFSARCSHAGGPLDEGTLTADGCVRCPWHGSEFRLPDGSVERGPATSPQPVWATQVEAGRVLVRAA